MLWNRHAAKTGVRESVFSLSMGDWADAEVAEEWRADMFDVIRATPYLDWLLLSKRHALVRGFLNRYAKGITNIRVGFTVEDPNMASIRMPQLRKIKQDGWPTFVSYEPALGAVDWDLWLQTGAIDWLIAGGESGPGFRAPNPDWFRDARDACRLYGVPFHFKQWGAMRKGHELDGRDHLEFPKC
jgi:protein gp37